MNFDTSVNVILVVAITVLTYFNWRDTKEVIRMMDELEPLLNELIREKNDE